MKKNALVLGAVVLLIALVAVLAAVMPQSRTLSADAPSLSTEEPQATPEPTPEATQAPASEAQPTAAPEPTNAPAAEPAAAPATEAPEVKAYLVVSVQGVLYEPLPLAGEGAFTLSQDEHTSNTVHVTADSVWMEHSTCDNQDCVDQGVVSLENMENRVLSNMIVCLPNEVVLELHTPETLSVNFGYQP